MASHLQAVALVASLFLSVVFSQFLSAPTDLTHTHGYCGIPVRYKEVPDGICELTPGVKSYSGYVDVAEDQHIFFWFFEARNQDPTTAPLTIWINGGPGSSSMIGLFAENGPCSLTPDLKPIYNPYSWNNVSNMLYIEQPTQTGLSYSYPIPGYEHFGRIVQLPEEKCPRDDHHCATYSYPSPALTSNTTINAAPNFWRTLQGFMGAFPQYSANGYHFTTESYGGHYGPVFNEYIQEKNAEIAAGKSDGHHIDLRSVMIGNGWYDPLIQYQAYYNFTVYPGNTYDYSPYSKELQEKVYNAMYGPGNCYDQTVDCYTLGWDDVCHTADKFCYFEVEFALDEYAGRNEYDIRELDPDPFPYFYFTDYLNLPHVQKAIGAFTNYSSYSAVVGDYSFGTTGDDDKSEGAPGAVKKLIDQGIYMVQYNGDADYNCNWLGNVAVIEQLVKPPGYSSAGFTNVSTSDDVVHGQAKQSGNFAFVRVYESGHEVPFYQPLISLEMLERVLKGLDVATGTVAVSKGSGYKTSGPSESTYREGNSTVQFKVLPSDATYNITTDEPNPTNKTKSVRSLTNGLKRRSELRPRSMGFKNWGMGRQF